MARDDAFRVVIAGGGVAALETALALRQLAGDRVALTIVAPNAEFVDRPMTVAEPFGSARARRHPIAAIAADVGAELLVDRFSWVDVERRVAHTEGRAALDYDALVLGLGARGRPSSPHVVTIDDGRMDDLLEGIVQDLEGGYITSLAFLASGALAWPLPIYELALMSARRAYDMSLHPTITIVTPEPAPLAVFGEQVSSAVAALLADAGIALITSASAQIPAAGTVAIEPGAGRLAADRVIALPELYGPAVRGLPGGERGFIPIDAHSRVRGVDGVFAAGDATDFAIKHGGIAAQQADAAAASVAALAGASVDPQPSRLEIHGILLTGAHPLYISAQLTGGEGFRSQVSREPEPGTAAASKVSSRYLAPYLAARVG